MASVQSRLETLEQDVRVLKQLLLPKGGKVRVSIKGALRGARFGEKDVRDAKRSLFPEARIK
jgi:hypothetical protein